MPQIRLPIARQLPGIRQPQRRDFTSEILAIRGQNPLAQGITELGKLGGQAIDTVAKRRRELAQLMALSQQLAKQTTPEQTTAGVRIGDQPAQQVPIRPIPETQDQIDARAQDIFKTLTSLGNRQQALNIAGQKAIGQQLETSEQARQRMLGTQKLESEINKNIAQAEKARREPEYVLIGSGGQRLGSLAKGQKPVTAPAEQKSLERITEEEVAKQTAKQKVLSKKDLLEAQGIYNAIVPSVDRVLELNKNSYGGKVGAAIFAGKSAANLGVDNERFRNTADVINTMRGEVTKVLKSVFGGQLSEGEREYLNNVYGAIPELSQVEREIAMTNMKRMMQSKLEQKKIVYLGWNGKEVPNIESVGTPSLGNKKGNLEKLPAKNDLQGMSDEDLLKEFTK